MFRYMPRSGYRLGEKRVEGWVSVAVLDRVRVLAAADGVSVCEWVGVLVAREAGVVADGGGVAAAGNGSVVDWDALLERGARAKAGVMGRVSLSGERDPIEEIA